MPRHPSDSLDWGAMEVEDMDMGDGRTVEWASEFLSRKHEKPFFLAVGIFQPHLPFYAPKKYFDKLPLDQIELPINKPGDLDDIPVGGQKMAEYRRKDLRMIEQYDDLQHTVQSYLASIAHADTMVGEVIKAIDNSEYRDNTIIVLWSDHGYAFGEKDHYAKNTLWERSTHIPFIVAAPGVTTAGTQTNAPVDLTCIYPTLTRLCGLPMPEDLDGIDITPLLKKPNSPWKHPAIIDYLKGNTAVRTKDWRYIRYAEGREGEELYDLVSDPNEWTNLITTHKELTRSFESWLPESYAEEVPTKGAYKFDLTHYSWEAN
jgi:arylsulfatase A-like enzyme